MPRRLPRPPRSPPKSAPGEPNYAARSPPRDPRRAARPPGASGGPRARGRHHDRRHRAGGLCRPMRHGCEARGRRGRARSRRARLPPHRPDDPLRALPRRRRRGRPGNGPRNDRRARARRAHGRAHRPQLYQPSQRDCERDRTAFGRGGAYQGAHRLHPQDHAAPPRHREIRGARGWRRQSSLRAGRCGPHQG